MLKFILGAFFFLPVLSVSAQTMVTGSANHEGLNALRHKKVTSDMESIATNLNSQIQSANQKIQGLKDQEILALQTRLKNLEGRLQSFCEAVQAPATACAMLDLDAAESCPALAVNARISGDYATEIGFPKSPVGTEITGACRNTDNESRYSCVSSCQKDGTWTVKSKTGLGCSLSSYNPSPSRFLYILDYTQGNANNYGFITTSGSIQYINGVDFIALQNLPDMAAGSTISGLTCYGYKWYPSGGDYSSKSGYARVTENTYNCKVSCSNGYYYSANLNANKTYSFDAKAHKVDHFQQSPIK